ncbi:hypothetical protein ACQPX6_09660 [Actinomycetospora sp. CA-101289]|uniref:hypothetical protein n=1 Tax=Actinomycetospora sp. CA-101289 TaxID=3239893 RepID=UPI003D977C98
MSEQRDTDPATVVPDAAPLRGEPAEPNQPNPEDVLPIGGASETEHLVQDDEG